MRSSSTKKSRVPSRRLLALVSAAVLAAVATGPIADAGGGGEPKSGGTISYGFTFEARGLDPLVLGGATASNGDGIWGYMLYDSLLLENRKNNTVVGQTAESLESEDGINWVLKVKEGIEFTDETPYDAAAVQFNWERFAAPGSRYPNGEIIAQIDPESYNIPDPLTLEFALLEPNFQFPSAVAKWLGVIASPTAIQGTTDADADTPHLEAFDEAPVGAGPFILTEWVRGSDATFERNPNYWDAPKPYIDNLEIHIIDDQVQRYNAFVSGQTNVSSLWRSFPQIIQAEEAGYRVVTGPAENSTFLFLNHEVAPFNDPIAREAFTLAIDRKQAARTIGLGYAKATTHLFPKATGFRDAASRLPAFNRPRAQRLFDQYAEEHGEPAKIRCRTSVSQGDLCVFIQSQLAQFTNVELEVETGAPQSAITVWRAGAYEASQFSVQPYPDPDLFIFLACDQRYAGFMRYCSEEMTAALTDARTAASTADQRAAYKRVQQQFLKDLPLIFISNQPQHTVFADNVRGYKYANDAIPLFQEMWLADA